MVHRTLAGLTAAALLVLSAGCAMQAPAYSPSLNNVDTLKRQAQPARPGAFVIQPGATGGTSIGLRGSDLQSPVGGNYAAYIAEALRQELQLAGKLDPASPVEIGGTLVRNDLDATGLSTGNGELEVRFTVRQGATLRYEKLHRAEVTWESSFLGSVAIPAAQQQYPRLVQQLLQQLFSDRAFFDALK